MPKVDFNDVPDTEDFSPLPDGDYRCRCDEIKEEVSKNGNDMWNMTFIVTGGEYKNRKIFDNMVFTEKAMNRVKLISHRLGGIEVDTIGEIDLRPPMFIGKEVILTVIETSYADSEGNEKKKNKVIFGGYAAIKDEEPDDNLGF